MELHIEIHPKGYKVITCDEGYVFTDWDKKDIMDFNYSVLTYAPLDFDTSAFYIMEEGAARIIEEKRNKEYVENN